MGSICQRYDVVERKESIVGSRHCRARVNIELVVLLKVQGLIFDRCWCLDLQKVNFHCVSCLSCVVLSSFKLPSEHDCVLTHLASVGIR